MTKELEGVLVKVLEKTINFSEKTVDFVMSEAPDIIQQLLTFHLIENSVYGLIALIVTSLMVYGVIKSIKIIEGKVKKSGNSDERSNYLLPGVLCVLFLPAPLVLISSVFTVCKIYFAPKLYLMEYLLHIKGTL